MIRFLRSNNCFLLPFYLFLIAAFIAISITPKGNFELWLNGFHNEFFDQLFKEATFIGDGWFFFLVALFILISNIAQGLALGIIGGVVSLVSGICKHLFFANTPRPLTFIHDHSSIHLVDGVIPLYTNSFPSGHTMSAFALCFFVSILFKKKWFSTIMFFVALAVGISRMYLMQHFLLDVFAGSILGVLIVSFLFPLLSKNILNNTKLNRPLFRYEKKH